MDNSFIATPILTPTPEFYEALMCAECIKSFNMRPKYQKIIERIYS